MNEVVTEWLETDGLGGYASMPVSGPRTRKYHGWYCSSRVPPVKRIMYVSDLLISVIHKGKEYNLTPQKYENAEIPVDSSVAVKCTTWPAVRYTYTILDVGTITLEYQLIKQHSVAEIHIRNDWKEEEGTVVIRPLCKCCDHHQMVDTTSTWKFLHKQPEHFIVENGENTLFIQTSAKVVSEPHLYEQIKYSEEEKRGYENKESLYSFGQIICTKNNTTVYISNKEIVSNINSLANNEREKRLQYSAAILKTADDFIVERQVGDQYVPTIIAGYPWFTDWGRDTFIAMRGLLLAQEKYDTAEKILLFWAKQLKNGLLPNRFIDETNVPEYNSVDSPLWFCIVAYEYCKQSNTANRNTREELQNACLNIIDNWCIGTDFGIKVDEETSLVHCGHEGVQLTWMDAKFGDTVVTPRIGFPVEIQCLWINVLFILEEWNVPLKASAKKAKESFVRLFWNDEKHCLYDYITTSTKNSDIRPNQIFAIGGLPFFSIDTKENVEAIFSTVQRELFTEMGLRTLSPDNNAFQPTYGGSQPERDKAYHQGTAWPWLLGPYCDAFIHMYGDSTESRNYLRKIWNTCREKSSLYGVNGICEIADGSVPHNPNGCPWQAWSVAEYLRIAKKYNL